MREPQLPARVLAFDLGASSGRAMLASYDGERIQLEELHRFPNDPVLVRGTLYWDVLRLLHEIKQGLLAAKARGAIPDSIGLDTWGVDFGLLGRDGRLLENPVHYRDSRTAGYLERAFQRVDRAAFYRTTGSQIMEINTVFQLLSLAENRPELLDRAETLLLMPDLLCYLLTGSRQTEYTIATTTQLLDAADRSWSAPLLAQLGLPRSLLTTIVPPGTPAGPLEAALREELGLPPIPVVRVASHDTQSAALAAPAEEQDFLFVSCGTWSLFGTERDAPLLDDRAMEYNLTNEGGVEGTTTFLKNITGLWLIQESRRQWKREGQDFSFAELERLAREAAPFRCFIDPDAALFAPPGDLPGRVRQFCAGTGQPVPETAGEVVRCLYESLAFAHRLAAEQIEACTGRRYRAIHVVGGGARDALLCQMTASACGKEVTAGPVEATVYGNAAVQLMAAGVLSDRWEARRVIAHSEEIRRFQPLETAAWDAAYDAFRRIVSGS